MLIKDELEKFLVVNMKNLDDRNKERIIYYFGFVDGKTHTTTESHKGYRTNSENPTTIEPKNPRSGPAAVIKKFKEKFQDNPIESLQICAGVLQKTDFISTSNYLQILLDEGLIEFGRASVKGILDLMNQINLCKNYGLFGYDLCEIKRENAKALLYPATFLIDRNIKDEVRIALNQAESLPGTLGLARFSQLKKKLGKNAIRVSQIEELIRENCKNIVIENETDIFYFIGKGKNILVNNLGKVFNVAKNDVEIGDLSTALFQAFSSRTGIDDTIFPPPEIIREFVRRYQFTRVTGDYVAYFGEKTELSAVEKDVVNYFVDQHTTKWAPMKSYLEKQINTNDKCGYGQASLQGIFSSPILKRRGTRGNYIYSLIGSADLEIILEDIAQGGIQGTGCFRTKKGFSAKEFADAQKKLKKTGLKGEKIVDGYLAAQKEQNLIADYKWDSSTNVISSHDFTIFELDGSTCYVDVKTTIGTFFSPVHISMSELLEMQRSTKYIVYRVYDIETQPKIRKSEKMKNPSRSIISSITTLPTGVAIDSFSISLQTDSFLKFEDEIIHVNAPKDR